MSGGHTSTGGGTSRTHGSGARGRGNRHGKDTGGERGGTHGEDHPSGVGRWSTTGYPRSDSTVRRRDRTESRDWFVVHSESTLDTPEGLDPRKGVLEG